MPGRSRVRGGRLFEPVAAPHPRSLRLRSGDLCPLPVQVQRTGRGQRKRTLMLDKPTARALAKARRAAIPSEQRQRLSAALVAHAAWLSSLPPGGIISGFLSIGEEIDLGPLTLALSERGHTMALPVMQGRGKPLLFRAYAPGDALAATTWGIREPLLAAAAVAPAVLLVPLLAFDASGNRLGYGGGFYDRTILDARNERNITAVGVAFDEQRLDAVPHGDYDEPLDWVLTPSGPHQTVTTG
jgi:5-formyltetrahydrofolate cyclo-ligase